jgi:hypothetical protein
MMKKWQYQIFSCLLIVLLSIFGWGKQVIAAEIAQIQTTTNVYDYLLQYQPESYNILNQTLANSIEDAKQPNSDELVNNLLPLSPENPKIKWRENNGKIEYLMSTWKYSSNPSVDWPIGKKIISLSNMVYSSTTG